LIVVDSPEIAEASSMATIVNLRIERKRAKRGPSKRPRPTGSLTAVPKRDETWSALGATKTIEASTNTGSRREMGNEIAGR
jgi:hypothetical protein